MKRTGWYPASIKPVRTGWYEWRSDFCDVRKCRPHLAYLTFKDGWMNRFAKEKGARWRGLAQDPKAKK